MQHVVFIHEVSCIVKTKIPVTQSLQDEAIIIDHARQGVPLIVGIQCRSKPLPLEICSKLCETYVIQDMHIIMSLYNKNIIVLLIIQHAPVGGSAKKYNKT